MKHDPYRWRDTRRTILRCWPYLGYRMVTCGAVALFLTLYWALVSVIRHLAALVQPEADLLVLVLASGGLLWLGRRMGGHLIRVRAGFAALLALRRGAEWPSFTSQVRYAGRAVTSRFDNPAQVVTILRLMETSLQEIDRHQQVPAAFFPLRRVGRWRWFRRACAWLAARPLTDALLSFDFRSERSVWSAAADGIRHFVRDRAYLLAIATGFQAIDIAISAAVVGATMILVALPLSTAIPMPFESLAFLVPLLVLWVIHHAVVAPIHVTMLTLAMEKRRTAVDDRLPMSETELERLSPSFGEVRFQAQYSPSEGLAPFQGGARVTLGRRPLTL